MKIAGYKPAQIILLAVMLGACETSRAQTSWAAAANGNWNTAASWSPAVVPGVGTNASIIVAGTYTVTYNSAMSAGSIASLTLGSNTSSHVEFRRWRDGSTLGIPNITYTDPGPGYSDLRWVQDITATR